MRSKSLFLGVLVAGGLCAAYWFLLLAPKREEVTALESQVVAKQQEVSAAEAMLTSYREARENYTSLYARVTGLGKAVPSDDDVRSLVVQIDAAAAGTKVNFRSISAAGAGGPSTAPAGETATGPTPPPGAVASSSGGVSTMPFALKFTGGFSDLSSLFTEIEKFVSVQNEQVKVKGRLMRVDSIVISPRPGTAPGELQADVTASAFLVSPLAGVTGAAAGSAGATPAATGTTPTTTAAVTGAIE
jgi:hypothetical protein